MSCLLARSAFAAFGMVGVLAWAGSASAFCRTTTQPLPADYSPTRGCFTQGKLLFWRNACVGYSLNEAASRNIDFATAKTIIDQSFGAWMAVACQDTGQQAGISVTDMGSAACSEVTYNPDGKNQNVIIFRDDSWPYSDPNSTLGLTTVTFNADTGEMYDADMEINSSGHNLSTTDAVPTNGFDLASVVSHEAGHFFGLAHATNPNATMFASYKPGRKDLRTLDADDASGLCAIYPDANTRVVTATATQGATLVAEACNPNPKGGLSTQCHEANPKNDGGCEVTAPARSSNASLLPLLGFAAIGLACGRRLRGGRTAGSKGGSARPR